MKIFSYRRFITSLDVRDFTADVIIKQIPQNWSSLRLEYIAGIHECSENYS